MSRACQRDRGTPKKILGDPRGEGGYVHQTSEAAGSGSCLEPRSARLPPLDYASQKASDELLQRLIIRREIHEQAPEPSILVLERSQPPGFVHLEPAALGLPAIERALADAMPPAETLTQSDLVMGSSVEDGWRESSRS
jgi:hypothetical protein